MPLLLVLALVLLLIVLGLSSLSSAATATTGLTLAASNLAAQATIQLLTCTLLAVLVIGLPGLLYAAFRIGKIIAWRDQESIADERPPLVITLPPPETPKALPAPTATGPITPPARRRVRRVRRSVSQAARLSRGWFK